MLFCIMLAAVRRFILLSFSVASIALATPASSADFRLKMQNEWQGDITLRGEIKKGDLDKLKATLGGRAVEKGYPFYLDLNSRGGNFDEAIKIARFALDSYLSTRIGPNSECLSACAIIFMAGTNFTTVGNSLNRELHVSGRLGFHAPSIGVAGTADANQPYDEAVDAVGGDLLALARFRGRMWSGPLIKSDLINEMMLRRGTNYYFIDTVRKAAEFEIDLVGAKSPAITAASVKAGCANALALNTSSALANATWYGDVMVAMTSEGRKFTVPLSRGQCIVVVAARSNGDGQYATFAVSEINGAEGSTIQLPLWHFWPGNTPLRAISGVN